MCCSLEHQHHTRIFYIFSLLVWKFIRKKFKPSVVGTFFFGALFDPMVIRNYNVEDLLGLGLLDGFLYEEEGN
jgi:hypothetical protein